MPTSSRSAENWIFFGDPLILPVWADFFYTRFSSERCSFSCPYSCMRIFTSTLRATGDGSRSRSTIVCAFFRAICSSGGRAPSCISQRKRRSSCPFGRCLRRESGLRRRTVSSRGKFRRSWNWAARDGRKRRCSRRSCGRQEGSLTPSLRKDTPASDCIRASCCVKARGCACRCRRLRCATGW